MKVEYRKGIPKEIDQHRKRGGWWQHKRNHRPTLVGLRVSRVPHPDKPENTHRVIACDYTAEAAPGWYDLERRYEWENEENRFRKESYQEQDPNEWLWRPCTIDGDPLHWFEPDLKWVKNGDYYVMQGLPVGWLRICTENGYRTILETSDGIHVYNVVHPTLKKAAYEGISVTAIQINSAVGNLRRACTSAMTSVIFDGEYAEYLERCYRRLCGMFDDAMPE